MTGLRRYANRRDGNEAHIVAALRRVGAMVYSMDKPCDLLIGFRRQVHLAEVKGPKGQLTATQRAFHAAWQGSPIHIIRTVDDALRLIGARVSA